jgi:hypothetical protein
LQYAYPANFNDLTIQGVFSQVKELACTSGFESFATIGPTTGRATHAGQVLSKVMDKEIPWQVGGWVWV